MLKEIFNDPKKRRILLFVSLLVILAVMFINAP